MRYVESEPKRLQYFPGAGLQTFHVIALKGL